MTEFAWITLIGVVLVVAGVVLSVGVTVSFKELNIVAKRVGYGLVSLLILLGLALVSFAVCERYGLFNPVAHVDAGAVTFAKNQQGDYQGCVMGMDSGVPVATMPIHFGRHFGLHPRVVTGVSGIAFGSDAARRFSVNAENVTEDGFDLTLRAWNDPRPSLVEVSWVAADPNQIATTEQTK